MLLLIRQRQQEFASIEIRYSRRSSRDTTAEARATTRSAAEVRD